MSISIPSATSAAGSKTRQCRQLQGRLGAALNYEKSYKNENDENYRSVKAYGLLNVYHEFHDGTNVLIAGDKLCQQK